MILRCCLLCLVFFTSAVVHAEETLPHASNMQTEIKKLKVIATIRPIHSLLSFIMQGTVKPVLLLDKVQSAHHYSLRPSQRSSLAHADIVFWVGEALESFMPRVLRSLPKNVQVIELMDSKGLSLLTPRSMDNISAHHHDNHGNIDPHIWLSIDNAFILASKMSEILSLYNPAAQKIYRTNLKKLNFRLNSIKTNLTKSFLNSEFNYLVYHDAFQYFEKQINLEPLIAISTDEEQAPGIRHLTQVNKLIANNKINCLIYNTSTLPAVANNIINNSIPKIYSDPLGQDFNADEFLYFKLLNSLSKNYQLCKQSLAR